ncbi:hypothetical protein FHS20_003661 [Phyllobacterium endophyticum]|nr:hypothetical protein [Phyllobacterium endophyticum]
MAFAVTERQRTIQVCHDDHLRKESSCVARTTATLPAVLVQQLPKKSPPGCPLRTKAGAGN